MSQLQCPACSSSAKPHVFSVYPFIDPKVHYEAQNLAGKVVLITGASRGIGLETALHFARAGASLMIVARKQEALDASKDTILRERPSAQVLTFPADVRDVKKAEEAVAATVAHFGHLDILVANAAAMRPSFQRACSFSFILCRVRL
jgi:NAD(P)-dependent dehydrogenase (short-subunit alcohol dehydrogenase family)